MSDSLIGTTLAGKYLIKQLIGSGGMGAVYEGEHVEIGKRVAIKVIGATHTESPEIAARFRREARAASAVESDNIVQVFDVGQDPSAGLYMVMEYLAGQDLASRLHNGQRLEVPAAVTVGYQAARALAKAHAAGVIHRDLKPANLFLTARDDDSIHVKVLDFGISKLTRDQGGRSQSDTGQRGGALTRKGVVIGTPQYMSPEQAQGLPLDHRTDVWSLGAVLYEALAGVQAYQELSTYEQTIIQIVMRAPPPLTEVAPWVPPQLAAVIHGALTHDIEKRIQDCATLARRLSEAVPGAGASARFNRPFSDEVRSVREPPRSQTPQVVIRAPASGSAAVSSEHDVHSMTVAEGPAAPPTPVGAVTASPLPLVSRGHTTSGVAVIPEMGKSSPLIWMLRPRSLLWVAGASMAAILVGVGLHGLGGNAAPPTAAAVAPPAASEAPVAVATPTLAPAPAPSNTAADPKPPATTESTVALAAPLTPAAPPSSGPASPASPPRAPRGRPPAGKPQAKPGSPPPGAPPPAGQFGGTGISPTL